MNIKALYLIPKSRSTPGTLLTWSGERFRMRHCLLYMKGLFVWYLMKFVVRMAYSGQKWGRGTLFLSKAQVEKMLNFHLVYITLNIYICVFTLFMYLMNFIYKIIQGLQRNCIDLSTILPSPPRAWKNSAPYDLWIPRFAIKNQRLSKQEKTFLGRKRPLPFF